MIKNGITCNEKNRITDRHIKKTRFHKKTETQNKHSDVPLTSKQGMINSKKAALIFKIMKNQVMSGSQDQKEKKTASTLTTNFFGQKITKAQIRFCNDR